MQLLVTLVLAGCLRTQSEVAVKPVDINLNISGRLELVITDARRQEEVINGEKPKRTVRPEDIGLPPVPPAGSGALDSGTMLTEYGLAQEEDACQGSGRKGQLVQQMAARRPQVKALLDGKLVGESHTGFLVPKGTLSASQRSIVDAENADRTELYELEAAEKKTTVEEVALGYYLARLEHVSKGTWVERFDKAARRWDWFQWDR
jgi:uncharacterized protein YdbL (DUF1318 family)